MGGSAMTRTDEQATLTALGQLYFGEAPIQAHARWHAGRKELSVRFVFGGELDVEAVLFHKGGHLSRDTAIKPCVPALEGAWSRQEALELVRVAVLS